MATSRSSTIAAIQSGQLEGWLAFQDLALGRHWQAGQGAKAFLEEIFLIPFQPSRNV